MNFSMKICVSLILLFITACSTKQNIPIENCTIDEFSRGSIRKCVYSTHEETEIKLFHENGTVFIVMRSRNEKMHGLTMQYDDSGNITHETMFIDDINVHSKHYSDNNLSFESKIVGDDEINTLYLYSDSNTLLSISNYVNGELGGIQKKYYNDTEVIYEYKNGEIVSGYCNIKSANTIIPLSANDIIEDNYGKLCFTE